MAINLTVKQPKKININTRITPKIIQSYNYPPPTGQTTEYAQFDDAWQYFNIWKPIWDGLKGKKVVTPVLEDYFTLQNKNEFGNFSRFTDINEIPPTNKEAVLYQNRMKV